MRATALNRLTSTCVGLLVAVVTLLAVPDSTLTAQAAAQLVLSPELEQVRATLDKYRDPVLAVHDGYFSTVGCVEYPEGGHEGTMQYAPGGMGVHFLNMQLVGSDPGSREAPGPDLRARWRQAAPSRRRVVRADGGDRANQARHLRQAARRPHGRAPSADAQRA